MNQKILSRTSPLEALGVGLQLNERLAFQANFTVKANQVVDRGGRITTQDAKIRKYKHASMIFKLFSAVLNIADNGITWARFKSKYW